MSFLRPPFVAATALASAFLAATAAAQTAPPALDVPIGIHVSQLAPESFVDPACPGLDGAAVRLWRFDRFAACTADATGLVTVTFRHDDTEELAARARGNQAVAVDVSRNMVGTVPATFALGVDPAGHVAALLVSVAASAEGFAALQSSLPGTWACEGTAPDARCTISAGGRSAILEAGDNNGVRAVTLTITADAGAAPVDPALATPLADTRPGPPYSGRMAAFLAGASVECPGCDLTDADLRYRDLSGANLVEADLSGALLHGTSLAGADLTGARLGGANLNRTDLSGAILRGTDLSSAMLFGASAVGADFTGAGLASALLGETDFSTARFDGASVDGANLRGAVLDGASLFFATLRYAVLDGASLVGADLRGAIVADGVATGAIFTGADLSDAAFTRADLRRADLSAANLTGTDFVDTLLDGARFDGATLAGADFTGATPAPPVP